MHKKSITDKEFRRLKVITSAQKAKADQLAGINAGKRKLSQFGNFYLIMPHRIWIIDRGGQVMFSGRPGKSPN